MSRFLRVVGSPQSLFALLLVVSCSSAQASTSAPAPTDANGSAQSTVSTAEESSALSRVKKKLGLNVNSFFAGPGVGLPITDTPGFTGLPSDTGLGFFNLISGRYKLNDRIALDVQFRNQLIVTNQFEFRHQGQRFGVSGKLLSGENWSVTGALNSDLPIRGIMGQIPTERTLIFNPGMFANYSYNPSGSRWSLFALLTPRVWFYRDRQAVAVQDRAGSPSNPQSQKPEYVVSVNPSANYAVNEKVGVRLGTTLEYSKFVGIDAATRGWMPMELGVTYDVTPAFSVYTYLMSSTPLDDGMRQRAGITENVPWYNTASINLWLSGTVF